MKKTTGEILKQYRKKNKITAVEIAEKLNVTKAYISQVENNKKAFSLQMLKKLVEITGQPYEFWLDDKAYTLNREVMARTNELIDVLINNNLVKKSKDILNPAFRNAVQNSLVADTQHKLDLIKIKKN